MEKILEMECYQDGYATKHSNCIDIALATAAGYFDMDYYYYYLFLNTVFSNWIEKKDAPLFEAVSNDIMDVLGLRLDQTPSTYDTFLYNTQEKIIHNQPVILLANNQDIFLQKPERDNIFPHVMIINGFNDHSRIFYLMDKKAITKNSNYSNESEPFVPIQLPYDQILKIWKSYHENKKNNNSFSKQNSILSLIKIDKPKINSFMDLLLILKETLVKKNCVFNILINRFYEKNKDILSYLQTDIISVRRSSCMSLYVIFETLKRIIVSIKGGNMLIYEICQLQDDFIRYRSLTVSQLQIYNLRNKSFSFEKRSLLIKESDKFNEKLYVIVDSIINEANNLPANS